MATDSDATAATPHPFATERTLLVVVATALLFLLFGKGWLADLSSAPRLLGLFSWLFISILVAAFGVVRHADALAVKLGEPYGTLILTLSVISIEVLMISAVMLTGSAQPTLARDTMLAVTMIVMNGMLGASLLFGGFKHREQEFNLQGANAFLAVVIPLAAIGLIAPAFTRATDAPTYSTSQAVFIAILSLGLYCVFIAIQTIRHSSYFVGPHDDDEDPHDHHDVLCRSGGFHAVLLRPTWSPSCSSPRCWPSRLTSASRACEHP